MQTPRHAPIRRARRGLTLMEIMVVLAIVIALMVVAVPATRSLLELNQRKAARELVMLYQRLHDEAVLQNVTFRVIYHLAEGSYSVEMGEPGGLIFDNPEDREAYEEQVRGKLALMNEEERRKWEKTRKPFEKLGERFGKKFELPSGVAFGGIYTPQYEEMVKPTPPDEVSRGRDGDLEQDPNKVYSYIFSSGFTEHTVVWLVDPDDPESGYTVEVEPLSGTIHLHGELIDWRDSYDFVPEEGPDLPS